LSQCTRLTEGRTDRQKYHRKTALHSMQRGKNQTFATEFRSA